MWQLCDQHCAPPASRLRCRSRWRARTPPGRRRWSSSRPAPDQPHRRQQWRFRHIFSWRRRQVFGQCIRNLLHVYECRVDAGQSTTQIDVDGRQKIERQALKLRMCHATENQHQHSDNDGSLHQDGVVHNAVARLSVTLSETMNVTASIAVVSNTLFALAHTP